MINNFGTSNMNVQLQQFKVRKNQVDKAISSSNRFAEKSALNFDYFRLKRESKKLQEQITNINRSLHPDIIA
jgi:hypothetical protein